MDRAREDRWVKYQFLLPMLLLGFNLTSMSIYGSYLISVYIITFFSVVQKGCKCKLNLGKLNAAYMWFGHIQKFALLKKVQSWIPGRVFPLAAVALGVFSKTFLVLNANESLTESLSIWHHQQPCCNPRNIGSKPKSQERP